MTKTISMRLDDEEYKDLETLVESEGYSSKTEFVRELIREKWDEWARKVMKHAKEHPDEYDDWNVLRKKL